MCIRDRSEGKLKEEVMTAFIPPYKQPLVEDNNIRGNSSLADYAKLRPAFDRKHGTVTAANSTPMTDGAAAVILMTESRAKELGLSLIHISRIKPGGFFKSNQILYQRILGDERIHFSVFHSTSLCA